MTTDALGYRATMSPNTKKTRRRRTTEERIEELRLEIQRLEEEKKLKASPARKQARAGYKSLGKALELAIEEGDDQLASSIRSALEPLNGTIKAASKAGAARIRRSAKQIEDMQGQIVAFLEVNPGSGIAAIAEALDTTTKDLRKPLTDLVSKRKVTKKGQKRSTVYTARKRSR